jgi:hypothetical protein
VPLLASVAERLAVVGPVAEPEATPATSVDPAAGVVTVTVFEVDVAGVGVAESVTTAR